MIENVIKTEALIVGGGLAGLTLANAFNHGGIDSVVVDAMDPSSATAAEFDGRAFAIAQASWRMLEQLGITAHLAGQVQPILDIMVSDGWVGKGPTPLTLHFDHAEATTGVEALGNMVESRHMRVALLNALKGAPNARLLAPSRVSEVKRDGGRVRAVLDDGRIVEASVCLAVDGKNSQLRKSAGIRTFDASYDQSAIVTAVEHEKPHNGIAQEFFLPQGPFAVLPLPGNRSSLVWVEKTPDALTISNLDEVGFNHEMRARFGDYLGEVTCVGPRWTYPLSMTLANTYVAERLALVADAAHSIHPVAGQGLNLGLRDVAALAEVMVDAHRLGLDIGSSNVLKRYEQWRRFDNMSLALACDAMVRLFSNDIPPLRLARDVGMNIVGRIPPLRKLFMKHASGNVGELPKLLKGQALLP